MDRFFPTLETLQLLRDQQFASAGIYSALSVFLGLAAAFAGFRASELLSHL